MSNEPETSMKTIFDGFEECPFLYKKCIGKDSTCIGDLNKFKGCEIFLEKYFTAPPASHKLEYAL